MIFSDEFNGTTLDTTKWSTLRGSTPTYAGYGDPFNASLEDEYYTPNNVSESGGNLVLTLNQGVTNGYSYSSGMVANNLSFNYQYGYIEARVKVPDVTTGAWPAFWTVSTQNVWPPEFDVFEYFGANAAGHPSFNYHYGTGSSPQQSGPTTYGATGTDFTQDWHVYGMSWTPTSIQVYLDGQPGPSFTNAGNITSNPQYLMFNLAVYKGFTPPTGTQMLVDYVRVWQPVPATPTPVPTVTPTATPTPSPSPVPTKVPTPTPSPSPSPIPTSILQNGSFDLTGNKWFAPWTFLVQGGASGTLSQSTNHTDGSHSADIRINTSKSNDQDIELRQGNFPLIPHYLYHLTFWAKASKSRAITIYVQQNYSPNVRYLMQSVNLTTSWKQYTVTFTPSISETNAILSFATAQATGDVWLDQVSLK